MEARLSHPPFLNKVISYKEFDFCSCQCLRNYRLAMSFMFIVQEMWYFPGFPLAT